MKDLGPKEMEKVKTKEEKAKVKLEGEPGKNDLNVKSEMGGVLDGSVEGGGRGGEGGKGESEKEKERGPAVVQEGEQPQGAAR